MTMDQVLVWLIWPGAVAITGFCGFWLSRRDGARYTAAIAARPVSLRTLFAERRVIAGRVATASRDHEP
jgi:hypothetical protein